MNKTFMLLLLRCMELILAMVKAHPELVDDKDVKKAVFSLKLEINSLKESI